MGLIRLIIAAALGAAAMLLLPRPGVLAATQELIAFLSLLMAGLLPAMIVTATILRGGSFSARRVDEYGGALQQQLNFWAVLFVAAGAATAAIVIAKIFSAQGVSPAFGLGRFSVPSIRLVDVALAVGGAGVGVVLQRLRPAFVGLLSLLDLNVATAKGEALVNDRSRRDLLTREAEGSQQVQPYDAYAADRRG